MSRFSALEGSINVIAISGNILAGGRKFEGIGKIGLILFVYCVGVGAGGRFFASMRRQGSQLAWLALVVVLSGTALTVIFARLLDLPAGLAAGIFAGALTSTPALAAAIEGAGAMADEVVVGYGVAYPFGVIGVVLFVQVLPRLLTRVADSEDDLDTESLRVERKLVEVTNPNLQGKRLTDSALSHIKGCQVSRIWRGDRLEPVQYDDIFEIGQQVLLVGEPEPVSIALEMIGRPLERNIVLNADEERATFVVTNRTITGKPLRDWDPLKNHGVVITRISRMEFEFVPSSDTRLEPNDIVTVVGEPDRLKAFQQVVGHKAQAFSQTSLVSLAIGVTIGILIGTISIPLPGGNAFSLGLAGGPLLAALILGHFGRMGGIVGHIPRPTRVLLQEMGLVFFLADAGTRGGATIVDAVASQGLVIFLVGAAITLLPLMCGYIFANKVLGMSLFSSLGGICGGMTSTPALGAITARTTRRFFATTCRPIRLVCANTAI